MATNAFDLMMASRVPVSSSEDPWVTAIVYGAHLNGADPSEPLWHTPYFGQSLGSGTGDEVFSTRQRQHCTRCQSNPKELGFHAVIDLFGPDAIEWWLVACNSGPRSKMQAWVDAKEAQLIFNHGGVLRNMDARLNQTLNQTEGGSGIARWTGFDARRRHSLHKFKTCMETYVSEHGSSLVPQEFVAEDGYRLGAQLSNFRVGQMRIGLPEQPDIEAWAESLPEWAWNAKQTDAYRKAKSQERKDWWKSETPDARNSRIAKFKASVGTAECKARRSRNATAQRTKERRAELLKARAIVVPFVKSKKGRAEMWTTGTRYMIHGTDIRRVNKDGCMRSRDTVGPLVDPVPVGLFDTDSD